MKKVKRARNFEQLETRTFLAGIVTVDVLDGHLVVTGDELDNGLAIELLDTKASPGASPPANAFRIIPDATTAVFFKGLGKPGEPVVVSGVDGDGMIDLNLGEDRLAITGGASDVAAFGSLHIQTGPGADIVELAMLRILNNLSIESSQGNDTITLDETTARAVDMFLKIPGIKGEAVSAQVGKSTPILLRRVAADSIGITVDGAPDSITLEETTARAAVDMFIKMDLKQARQIGKSTPILMTRCRLGDVNLTVDNLPTSITLDQTTARAVDMFLKIPRIKADATSAQVGKSTPILLRRVAADSIGITVDGAPDSITLEETTARAAVDMFLKMDLKQARQIGKSTPILMTHCRLGDVNLTVDMLPTSITLDQTTAKAFKLDFKGGNTRQVGKSSPILLRRVAADSIGITVDGASGGITLEETTTRKAVMQWINRDAKQAAPIGEASPILLRRVAADSIGITVDGAPDSITLEETTARAAVDMFIKMDLKQARLIGKSTPILMTHCRLGDVNLTVDNLPTSITLDETTARAVDMFLKIPGIKGEAVSAQVGKSTPILLRRVAADSIGITVDGAPDSITLEETTARAAVDMFIKMDLKQARQIGKSTPILMTRCRLGDVNLTVDNLPTSITLDETTARNVTPAIQGVKREAAGGIAPPQPSIVMRNSVTESIDVKVANIPAMLTLEEVETEWASVSGDRNMQIVAHGLRARNLSIQTGGAVGSQVRLQDAILAGDLSMILSNGDDTVDLSFVQVKGAMDVQAKAGADQLRIANSSFAQTTTLDGGRGKDFLQIVDTAFGTLPMLLSWETIL